MSGRLVSLAFLGAFACSPAAPAAASRAAGEPSSGSGSLERSASSSAGPRPLDDGRCLATFAKRRPEAGWSEIGKLVVTVQDGQPTSIRADDANGKAVETRPAPKSSQDARQDMRELTCRLGGLVLLVGDPPRDGAASVTFPVLGPVAPDEKTDLTALCREPADVRPTPDAHERYVIALESLDAGLTTRKWRAWLWQLLEEMETTEGLAREELRTARADELHTAALKAGLTPPCWYEEALRRRPPRQ